MPIPAGLAISFGLRLAMAGWDAATKGKDTLDPEQEAALRAEGRQHKTAWDDLFKDED